MSARTRLPWWMPVAAWGAMLALRLLGVTWRMDRSAMREGEAALAAGQRYVFAFWHARMLPLVLTHRGRGGVVLVSQHRDGEWIAQVLKQLGFGVARGSSTRGGGEGARQMLQAAREGRILGITPDGPRGPRERVKAGIVYLASRTGLPVVPVATAARRAWVLNSWDGFRIPKLFASVVVAYGPPIHVPAELNETNAEVVRAEIEQAIGALTRGAAVRAGENLRAAGAAHKVTA